MTTFNRTYPTVLALFIAFCYLVAVFQSPLLEVLHYLSHLNDVRTGQFHHHFFASHHQNHHHQTLSYFQQSLDDSEDQAVPFETKNKDSNKKFLETVVICTTNTLNASTNTTMPETIAFLHTQVYFQPAIPPPKGWS